MATLTQTLNNGHYQKNETFKVYDGPLESLPYPAHFELDPAIEGMYTDGYAIIPGVLDAREVAELRAKMDSMGDDDAVYDHTKIGWCFNKAVTVEFNKDPFFLRYLDRPGLLDIAEAVIGKNCRVKGANIWITGPGRKMPVHVDFLPVRMPEEYLADPRVRVPISNCVAQFYLDDLRAEVGPTILVPGSHLSGRAPNNETHWNGKAPKAAMVKAGDVCLFRFDVWHGAYSNTSKDQRRYIMQLEYSHPGCALGYPPMAYESLYNPEVLKQATPRQRMLMGGNPPTEEKKY
jgi:hypothetical protein